MLPSSWICRQNRAPLLFFFGSAFACLGFLTDLASALCVVGLLVILNIVVDKQVWARFAGGAAPILEKLFFGSLLGLGFLSLAWVFLALFSAGRLRALLLIAWLLVLSALPAPRKPRPPAAQSSQPSWRQLLPLVLILMALLYFPFKNLGKLTGSGFAYRAYAADILKHFAITNAVTYAKVPPENPYFKGVTLRYYWTVYALPSIILAGNGDVQKAVLAFSITVDFLLLGALFLLMFSALQGRRRLAAYFFTLAPVLFLSFEGFYLLFFKLRSFRPLHFLSLTSGYNIDGLTRWWWGTPQIDTLLRTLLYTPQAAMSLGFFVIYLALRKKEDVPLFIPPLLLVFSLFANLLVGCAFAIFHGCDFLYLAVARRRQKLSCRPLWRQLLLTVLLLAAAVAVLALLGIIGQGSNKFLFTPLSARALAPFLFLNLGMLLVIGLAAGLAVLKQEPYLIAALAILAVIGTIRIQGFSNDISLKLSLPLAVILTLAAASGVQRLPERARTWAAALIFALCLPGIFSSVIDIYNSADIGNRRFTFYLPKEEMLMLHWARHALPQDAVVQDYPPARQEDSSNIPTFMARRTYVGDAIHGRLFFISDPAYFQRVKALEPVLADLPARQGELKKAGIQYLFWGASEQQAFHYVPRLKLKKRVRDVYLFEIR